MKGRILKSLIILGLAWSIIMLPTACVEEFEIESVTYEKVLVVDGNISDQSKTHQVILSYTSAISNKADSDTYIVSKATVWIEDDLGNRTNFIEQKPGTYTSPISFAGIAGRNYALFITTSEGKRYQSVYQELVAAPEITKIYHRFEIEMGDGEATSIPGLQFFIDVENADQGTQFYRYEWLSTHQIIVPYHKKYHYRFNEDDNREIIPFDEDVRECYKERRFQEVLLATSTNNSNGELREVPVNFSNASEFDVTSKFSLEVTQRAINAEAYSYFRKIELFNESNGSLFDKQQGMVVGNIFSLDNPNEQVLGYFEVSGAKSKRIFMELSDLDPEVMEYINRPCETYFPYRYEGGSLDSFYRDVEDSDERYRRSIYEIFDYDSISGLISLGHRLCVDCRRRGSVEKPDYWP